MLTLLQIAIRGGNPLSMAIDTFNRRIVLAAGFSLALPVRSAFAQGSGRRSQVYAGSTMINQPGAVFRTNRANAQSPASPIGSISPRLQTTRGSAQAASLLRFDQLALFLGVRPSAIVAAEHSSVRFPVAARASRARQLQAVQPSRREQGVGLERSLRTIVQVDDEFFSGRYYLVRETISADSVEVLLREDQVPPEIVSAVLDMMRVNGIAARRREGSLHIELRSAGRGAVFISLDEIQLRSMGIGPGSADFDLTPTDGDLVFT